MSITLTRLQDAAEAYHDLFLNDPHEQFSGEHISRLLCGLAASLKAEQMQQAADSVPMKKPSLEDVKEALEENGSRQVVDDTTRGKGERR